MFITTHNWIDFLKLYLVYTTVRTDGFKLRAQIQNLQVSYRVRHVFKPRNRNSMVDISSINHFSVKHDTLIKPIFINLSGTYLEIDCRILIYCI